MKGQISKKLLGAVAVLTVLCMVFVSITLAKYTQVLKGQDTARVAKFSYTVKDQANNLFSTTGVPAQLALFETADIGVLDVVGNQKLIAPGTTGSFTITVDNTSEVAINANFALALTNAGGVPIYFTYDNKNYSDVLKTNGTSVIDGTLADLATAMTNATPSIAMLTGTKSYPITWTWDFNGKYTGQTDIIDTGLGQKSVLDTIGLQITATLTQVD